MSESVETYLITGTSRGLGKDLAEHYIGMGKKIIGISRSSKVIKNPAYTHFCVDITKPDEVTKMFSAIRRSDNSTINVVINCAGLGSSSLVILESAENIQNIVNTNIVAPLLISRGAIKLMKKGKYGRIINIGSIHEKIEPIGGSIYSASKNALASISRVCAKEFYSFDVTVNTVGLSAYDTQMMRSVDDKNLANLLAGLTVKEISELKEIVNILDFFIDRRSYNVTGQTIYLGGVN